LTKSGHQKWDGKSTLFRPTFKSAWDGIYRPRRIGSAAPELIKPTNQQTRQITVPHDADALNTVGLFKKVNCYAMLGLSVGPTHKKI